MTQLDEFVSDPLLAEIEPESSRRMLQAALESFAARGFHATTTRDISRGAGFSPAAVYVHYASKLDLLNALSQIGHESVLEAVESAVREGSDPESRMRCFVAAFASWHAEHQTLARVLQYELGSLSGEGLERIIEVRRRFDHLVDRQLRSGVRAKLFAVEDIPGTRRAILSLCIDIARWYEPRSRSGPEDVAALYADLVMRMLRA